MEYDEGLHNNKNDYKNPSHLFQFLYFCCSYNVKQKETTQNATKSNAEIKSDVA